MRLAALLIALPCVAEAQASVTGFVRDSAGRPLAGATVAIEALSLRTTSDASGQYRLADVPAGLRLLRTRALGYQPVATMVRVETDATTRHDVVMEKTPQYLDTVVVRERRQVAGVGLAAFAERQRLGFGKFFDTTFLRKNEHRRVPDVLASVPGMRTIRPPATPCAPGTPRCFIPPLNMRVAVSTRLGKQCTMAVMLDGAMVSNGTDGDWESAFDLNMIQTSTLAAIEVYRSAAEVPGEFNSARSQCGVLVLWTRRDP